MQILPRTEETPIYAPTEGYDEHAMSIFEQHKDVGVYVYGHTHAASLTNINGKLIINTAHG